VLRKHRHSDRQRHRHDANAISQSEQVTARCGAGALGNFNGTFESRVRKQGHELVTAVSGRDVVRAQVALEKFRYFRQDAVTLKVTVGVIHKLEVIDIQNKQRERAFGGAPVLDFRDRCFHECTPQQQLRQLVFSD
jgi:hypothetical protein